MVKLKAKPYHLSDEDIAWVENTIEGHDRPYQGRAQPPDGAACIAAMLKFGYDKNKVIMVGDAPGDCVAVEKNGVHYYPILVNHEKESWEEAIAVAFGKLQSGKYAPYGAQKKQEFLQNLGG